MEVIVEVESQQANVLEKLRLEFPNAVEIVNVEHFAGDMGYAAAVVTLSGVVIPAVARIIIEQIRSKGRVSVKVRGIEVTGISEANAKDILDSILRREGDSG